jgi:hypothetical protein
MTLYAPNGLRITGTLERLLGNALIEENSLVFDNDGRLVYEYAGYTDVYWDSQESVLRSKPSPAPSDKAEQVFLDEEGGEWFASDLTDIPPHRGDDVPSIQNSETSHP